MTDIKELSKCLDDIEAQLGGSNGPTIRIRAFLKAYTEAQEPFANICVLPTADAGPTKFFTAASDPRGFPVFRHAAPVPVPVVPADMVLVPREPTEAMVQTGAKVLSEWVGGQVFDTKAYGAVSVFKEMIAAGEVKP